MLYEVITCNPEFRQHWLLICGSPFLPLRFPLHASCPPGIPRVPLRFILELPRCLCTDGCEVPRITSYNVCYTKLLRNDIVAALTREAGVEAASIGRIEIREMFSLVEVPAAEAEEIAQKIAGRTIRRRTVNARVDRGGGGERPGPRNAGPRVV